MLKATVAEEKALRPTLEEGLCDAESQVWKLSRVADSKSAALGSVKKESLLLMSNECTCDASGVRVV